MALTKMAWGRMTPDMEAQVASIVRGRRVYDFGSGQGVHARWLVKHCKAAHVTAIDRSPDGKYANKRLTQVIGYFDNVDMPERIDVGFVSWPSNHHLRGLVPFLERCETVIYLGLNDNTTMCGFPALFHHMLRRKLISYLPDSRNSMVIVGEPMPDGETRDPTPEETAALRAWQGAHSFGDISALLNGDVVFTVDLPYRLG